MVKDDSIHPLPKDVTWDLHLLMLVMSFGYDHGLLLHRLIPRFKSASSALVIWRLCTNHASTSCPKRLVADFGCPNCDGLRSVYLQGNSITESCKNSRLRCKLHGIFKFPRHDFLFLDTWDSAHAYSLIIATGVIVPPIYCRFCCHWFDWSLRWPEKNPLDHFLHLGWKRQIQFIVLRSWFGCSGLPDSTCFRAKLQTRDLCVWEKAVPESWIFTDIKTFHDGQYITQNLRGDFLVKRNLNWPHWSLVSTYCWFVRPPAPLDVQQRKKKHLESLRTKLNSQIARRLLSPMDRCFKITRYSKK